MLTTNTTKTNESSVLLRRVSRSLGLDTPKKSLGDEERTEIERVRKIHGLKGRTVAIDTETTGLSPYHGARIFCFAYVTDLGEWGFKTKTPQSIEWVRAVFADPSLRVVFHNAKFDLKMFTFEGIRLKEIRAEVHCTIILAKVYNGMMSNYDLRFLSIYFLNRDPKDKDEITDWLRKNKRAFFKEYGREPNFSDAPRDVVKRRILWDINSTLQLFYYLYNRVTKVSPTLYETERQLMPIVLAMENRGVQVDITRAKHLRRKARDGVKIIQHMLNDLVLPLTVYRKPKKGKTELRAEIITNFNPNSTALQMPAAFNKLGVPLIYKTKPKKGKKGGLPKGGGRWSFDEYSMIQYSPPEIAFLIKISSEEGWDFNKFMQHLNELEAEPRYTLIPLALKMTELSKMCSTYYDHIINNAVNVRVVEGREIGTLHCNFNQNEAMTGRFSSSNPNLQNMPRIMGPRECFVPRPGRHHYHFDYEQVEMKFFVHFSRDEKMANAVSSDIHQVVAEQIYNSKDVTSEQRKRAKAINFGIIYGAGAPKIAETLTRRGLKTSPTESAILVGNYHRKFTSIRKLTSKITSELMRNKFIVNPFGRRYHIPAKLAYKGLNYFCQGTSADLMKWSMVRVNKFLGGGNYKAKVIMTVHDELVVEVPSDEVEVVVPAVIKCMEDRSSFFVPMTVGCEVVRERWSKKEEVEL